MQDKELGDIPHYITLREWDSYDLGADCAIDKLNLDTHVAEQPHLVAKWGDITYQAKRIMNAKERNLKLTESQLVLDAAQGSLAAMLKDKKPTDAVIKAWVQIQPAYKKALAEYQDAESNFYYLEKNAMRALEHRKLSLKIEADLWITGYYSRSNARVTNQEATEEQLQEKEYVKQTLTESLARRARNRAETESSPEGEKE